MNQYAVHNFCLISFFRRNNPLFSVDENASYAALWSCYDLTERMEKGCWNAAKGKINHSFNSPIELIRKREDYFYERGLNKELPQLRCNNSFLRDKKSKQNKFLSAQDPSNRMERSPSFRLILIFRFCFQVRRIEFFESTTFLEPPLSIATIHFH